MSYIGLVNNVVFPHLSSHDFVFPSFSLFSLGVLFFFMIEKGYPFYEKDDKSLLKRIKEGDLSFNSEDVSD